MNSIQRVQKALNLENPDLLPYGEYAIDSDTVEKIIGHETYLRAKAKSQIAFWEGRRDEVVQSWKEDLVDLYSKLDCLDIVNLGAEACGLVPPKDYDVRAPKKIDENTWKDDEGKIYKYSEVTKDITMVHDPMKWERRYNVEDFKGVPEIKKPDNSVFEVIDYVIDKLGKDRFIIGPAGREASMILLGGMERGLMEYSLNSEAVKAAGEYEVVAGNLEDFYYIRGGVHAILWGQDFAYNSGPMISPQMFREFVLPNAKKRVRNIKEKFNVAVIKHACGNNWSLMDFFINIGYDCYQAIQTSAGMDIKELKKSYGNKICLWGGINYENLTKGNKEDLKKDIQYAVEHASQNGGFILGSSHSVGIGTNYDNFMFLLDEVVRVRSTGI